jgi:AraC-like DNA-binding protein
MNSNSSAISEEAWLRAVTSSDVQFRLDFAGALRKASMKIENRIIPQHVLHFVRKGEYEAKIEEQSPIKITGGSMLWLSPDVFHSFHLSKKFSSLSLCNLRFCLKADGENLRMTQKYLHLEDAWELQPYFEQLVYELRAGRIYSECIARNLLEIIYAGVFRRMKEIRKTTRGLNGTQSRMLFQYLESQEGKRITSPLLAQRLQLSHDYFSRMFRVTFGISPRTWIKKERIQQAAHKLLETKLNISEIAYSIGYDDIYLFSRQFKQVMGCSPRGFRNRQNTNRRRLKTDQ